MTQALVIGGGIAGLSAAAHLSRDAEVTVLEGEEALGYHASGRSAALIEQNYGAPSVQALNRASVEYLQTHDGGYLTPRGLMILGTAEEEEAFRTDLADMGLEEISVDCACGMVPVLNPDRLRFAGYHADAQDIDTDRLMQGFARTLRQNGGDILTRQKVRSLRYHNEKWELQTDAQAHRADIVINAAGAWADQIAGLAGVAPMRITPHRRSMARIPAPDGQDVSNWPMFFGVGESWYAKPDAGCLLVSPADEDPVEPHDAWAEEMTLATGIALFEKMVTTQVTRLLSSWAGLRSFAPDRTLVLGPDPAAPGFIWCAGQGGYGFQTAPAAGQLVADLVFGRDSALPAQVVAALKPERLR
ncbi:NAD(P)/FAD-dependent oxidoreductase [Roseobacter weihaiensis]|uniref:NAD(P)/FAD-dependent oxidoreductase n=1 Tax=Roseobacter weihaiensis TaxID=2763262 RepID=UPI001D09D10C|nr:FAD-dependent oxidoreductase [Roseobacter sp. H9]